MILFSGVFKEQGPPDLDEIVRRLFKKWNGTNSKMDAFKTNNGTGNSGGDFPNISINPQKLVVGIFSVIVVLVLISGFYIVEQAERAVTFRFGNPAGVSQPGLRWIIPFVEDKRLVNVTQVRTVEIGYRNSQDNKIANESLMLTDNLNIVDLQFAVQYLLKDPEEFLYNNRSPENAVLQVAETAMREVVGRSNIDFVLYEGREAVAIDTQVLMQDILDRYNTGILIQQVAIQNVQPPDQVQDAFEDAIKARQDRERKINEGEAYANDIVPKARGQSSRILEDAEAYRQRQIALAQGTAQRFSLIAAEYNAAPQVTRQRLYLDAIEDVMTRTNKVILDQSEGSNSLLYLPLDQLLKNSRENSILQDALQNASANSNNDSDIQNILRDGIRKALEDRRSQ